MSVVPRLLYKRYKGFAAAVKMKNEKGKMQITFPSSVLG